MLLISLAMLALGSLGFVVGEGLGAYFIARFMMGMGAGGIWMGVTFNVLQRYPGQEYLCMSRIFAAYAVGGLVGPALGIVRRHRSASSRSTSSSCSWLRCSS